MVEPDSITLHRHMAADPNKDVDTASSFEAWRNFEPGKAFDLGVCRGSIVVRHGTQFDRLHLIITLKRELPRGSTVADFIPQFTVDSKQTELQIDLPEKYWPQIVIEIPERTSFNAGLGKGTIDFNSIPGDLSIGVGKGDLLLHTRSQADYALLSAGFALGGVEDKRPGGKNHGHMRNVWSETGTGKYNVSLGAGWGHLVLLPQ